jgi:hypothetical protein
VAAEEQDAINALDMDRSSCGFDCACSRPAKTIKGAKKAANRADRNSTTVGWFWL